MRVAANAVNAACVRKAVHLEMREAVAAWRNSAGVSRVLARARLVMKEAASSLQRPPTSIPGIEMEFGVGSFFGFPGIDECCCGIAAGPTSGFAGAGEWGD